VNRIWAELVGEGFYEPVDDLGPDRQCSAPQTMDYLAGQFTSAGFDIRRLFETICSTQAYQRASRDRRTPNQLPFLANCSQPLRADQMLDALASALGLRDALVQRLRGRGAGRGGPQGQFFDAFGFDPSEPRENVVSSIPRALLLMNSPQLADVLNGRGMRTSFSRLIAFTPNDEDLVVELYLRSLSREPNDEELSTCLQYVRAAGNRVEAFEDIQWALINRAEFWHRD
jgi:hypothetical protein